MSKKKIVTSAVALGVAAAIGLGGTFAWQSINQTALNEASDIVNPGGRLHNDQWFVDAKTNNNDIYVENFTDKENGEDIYARVRLSEYMEIVMNYGIKDAEVVETVAGSKTPVEDSTYTATDATHQNEFTYEYETHYFNKENATDKYWNWELGKKDSDLPYFIPTFNMNKDSLLADLNGDYVDTLGGISNRKNEQYKYEEITSESSKTAYEVYDGDTNKLDEVTRADLLDLIENGTGAEHYDTYKDNIVLSENTHNATQVGVSNGLISMTAWNALDDGAKANYWVYDDSEDGDGWVYWSSPIEAGETTGLLLDSTELKEVMDDTWYYAIYVEAQFVTADDMGTPGEDENGTGATGFYKDGETVSDAAKDFLEEIGVDVDGTGTDDDDEDNTTADFTLKLAASDSNKVAYVSAGYTNTVALCDKDGAPLTSGEFKAVVKSLLSYFSDGSDTELKENDHYTLDGNVITFKGNYANYVTDGGVVQIADTAGNQVGYILWNDDGEPELREVVAWPDGAEITKGQSVSLTYQKCEEGYFEVRTVQGTTVPSSAYTFTETGDGNATFTLNSDDYTGQLLILTYYDRHNEHYNCGELAVYVFVKAGNSSTGGGQTDTDPVDNTVASLKLANASFPGSDLENTVGNFMLGIPNGLQVSFYNAAGTQITDTDVIKTAMESATVKLETQDGVVLDANFATCTLGEDGIVQVTVQKGVVTDIDMTLTVGAVTQEFTLKVGVEDNYGTDDVIHLSESGETLNGISIYDELILYVDGVGNAWLDTYEGKGFFTASGLGSITYTGSTIDGSGSQEDPVVLDWKVGEGMLTDSTPICSEYGVADRTLRLRLSFVGTYVIEVTLNEKTYSCTVNVSNI